MGVVAHFQPQDLPGQFSQPWCRWKKSSISIFYSFLFVLVFPMTLKLTLWITWPWDDLSRVTCFPKLIKFSYRHMCCGSKMHHNHITEVFYFVVPVLFQSGQISTDTVSRLCFVMAPTDWVKMVTASFCAAKGLKRSAWMRTWTPARRDLTSTRHPAHQQAAGQTGTTETEVSSLVFFSFFF